jgi:hypothetical protein
MCDPRIAQSTNTEISPRPQSSQWKEKRTCAVSVSDPVSRPREASLLLPSVSVGLRLRSWTNSLRIVPKGSQPLETPRTQPPLPQRWRVSTEGVGIKVAIGRAGDGRRPARIKAEPRLVAKPQAIQMGDRNTSTPKEQQGKRSTMPESLRLPGPSPLP